MHAQHNEVWPPGESEMARLLRAYTWQRSALGAPGGWPEKLRGAVEIMLASPLPTCIWWGSECLQLYNDPAISLYRFHHPGALAQPARETWAHFWNTLGAVVEEVIGTGRPALGEDLLLIADERRSFEDGNWFTVSAAPILGGERDRAEGAFITLFETTRRLEAETRVRASEVRAKSLFRQAPGIVLICRGPDHTVEFANDAANLLLDTRHLPGNSARQIALASGASSLTKLLDSAYRTGLGTEALELSPQPRESGGEPLYFDFAVVPIIDTVGSVTGVFVMGFDVTDRVCARGNLKVLIGELQHRARNLIGVIRAISTRSIAESVSLEGYAGRFDARLGTLGRVTSLLSQLRENEHLAFDALVRAELSAVGAIDVSGRGPQVTLDGPVGVSLQTTGVQTLALALHELTTNAVKYGGLATTEGSLSIRWHLDVTRTRLHVEWRERWKSASGAAQAAAERRGYGRTLIEEALPYQLKADTRYDIGAHGVDCSISLPL